MFLVGCDSISTGELLRSDCESLNDDTAMLKKIYQAVTYNKIYNRILRNHPKVNLATHLAFSPKMRKAYANYRVKGRPQVDRLFGATPPVRNLYIEGTNHCNADCVFCGYSQMQRPKSFMDMDFFKDLIDQYIDLGGRALGFTPIVGDPFVDKYFVERLQYANEKSEIKNIGFYTNGIAMTPKKMEPLFDLKSTQISWSVSFGGYDRESFHQVMGVDKFHLVKKHILHLLEQLKTKGHPNLRVKLDYRCLEKRADNELSEAIESAAERGLIVRSHLQGVYDTFGGYVSEERLAGLEGTTRLYHGNPKMGPCEILFTKPLVLADGRVNACAERDLEATLVIGDLKKNTLKEILTGEQRRQLIEKFWEPEKLPEVCKACTVYQSVFSPSSKVNSKRLNWTVTQ